MWRIKNVRPSWLELDPQFVQSLNDRFISNNTRYSLQEYEGARLLYQLCAAAVKTTGQKSDISPHTTTPWNYHAYFQPAIIILSKIVK